MYNDKLMTSERLYGKMIIHYFHIPCDIYSSFCKVELLSKVILAFLMLPIFPREAAVVLKIARHGVLVILIDT